MEVEAKLRTTCERVLDEIAELRRLAGCSIRALAMRELETLYLDTRQRDLTRGGIAFRVRNTGDGVELTIKLAGDATGAVHRRVELTWRRRRMPALQVRRLPPALRARLEPWTGRRPLVPLVGTRIRRLPLLVRRGGGAAAPSRRQAAPPGRAKPALVRFGDRAARRVGERSRAPDACPDTPASFAGRQGVEARAGSALVCGGRCESHGAVTPCSALNGPAVRTTSFRKPSSLRRSSWRAGSGECDCAAASGYRGSAGARRSS
jgi:CYTH domain